MGSSRHKSPHQALAFRRGHDVVLRSAHLAIPTMPYALSRTNICRKIVKSNCAVKRRLWECARWADLTIRLVVKANSKNARNKDITVFHKDSSEA